MTQQIILQILSCFDTPVPLNKILDIYQLLNLDKNYKDYESMKVATIIALNKLREKGLINITEERSNFRYYNISNLGLEELAKLEVNNSLYKEILSKVV